MGRLRRRRPHGAERAAGEIAVIADCRGDCDGDGVVTIDELVRGVSIAPGVLPATACAATSQGAAEGADQLVDDDLAVAVDVHWCGAS